MLILIGDNLKIKQASKEDKEFIKETVILSDEYHYKNCPSFAKKVNKNLEKHKKQVETFVDRINIKDFYIFSKNDKNIGSIMIWDNKGETTITNFFIKKEYRKKGLGRTFLKYAIKNIVKDYCVLCVHEENTKALNFYYKFGFKLIQEEESDGGKFLWLRFDKEDK